MKGKERAAFFKESIVPSFEKKKQNKRKGQHFFLEQKRHGHHRARAGRHIPQTPTYDPEHVVAG